MKTKSTLIPHHMKTKSTLITTHEIPGQHPVSIHQSGKRSFAVQYGAQIRGGLSWQEAAHEFGECVFHALECAALIER